MQLPRTWFEQAVTTLESAGTSAPQPSSGPPALQRRREPRVGVCANVTLVPLTEGEGNGSGLSAGPIDVPLRDLSPGGFRFLHAEAIPLDTQFVALLPHADESLALLCRVAYYQPLGERLFAVGAKFVRVLRRPAGAGNDDAAIPLPSVPPAPRRRAAS